MSNNIILGIKIGTEKVNEILEKVSNFLSKNQDKFFHIVNLNPDIFLHAYHDEVYRAIINQADAPLIDGIGIQLAAFLWQKKCGERMTGTDFMEILVRYAAQHKKKVIFLGGRDDIARLTGFHFKKNYPSLDYVSDRGADDIRKEKKEEKERVLQLVDRFKPDFIFVAYGPPYQEKWLWENRKYLKGIVGMGVGGAFKFISGKVKRAPKLMTKIGLEWLWRFIAEPHRLLKLPRLLYFIYIILLGWLKKIWKE